MLSPDDRHHCHAMGCTRVVRPEYLMCGAHWARVPPDIQRAVWRNYRRGQCDDKRPSEAWHEAADAAICSVALEEGRRVTLRMLAALGRFVSVRGNEGAT